MTLKRAYTAPPAIGNRTNVLHRKYSHKNRKVFGNVVKNTITKALKNRNKTAKRNKKNNTRRR